MKGVIAQKWRALQLDGAEHVTALLLAGMLGKPVVRGMPSFSAVALLAFGVGCTGSAFQSSDGPCGGSGCGAESGTNGGQGGGGPGDLGGAGDSGGGDSGGAGSGAGGVVIAGGSTPGGKAGMPGISGTGGGMGEPPPFPATDLLDDFDREGPALGMSWHGAADDFSIVEQALWCAQCTAAALWEEAFASEQEVYATLRGFDDDASEINLVLRAQAPDCELIEVLYAPVRKTVRVAYCSEFNWTDLAEKELALQPGDTFGARALASGELEIYANGQLVATYDASGFPHSTGRIGANGVAGVEGLSWDDFGGGSWR